MLLGECKWGTDVVGREVIRELIEEKAPKVVQTLPDMAKDWHVHYAFFARAGFTEAARVEAEAHGAMLVDLARLDRDLQQAMTSS